MLARYKSTSTTVRSLTVILLAVPITHTLWQRGGSDHPGTAQRQPVLNPGIWDTLGVAPHTLWGDQPLEFAAAT